MTPSSLQPLSDLEKQRQVNIARNEELLRQLELAGIGDQVFGDSRQKSSSSSSSSSSAKRKSTASKTRRSRIKPDPELIPRRKSRRLEGQKAEFDIERENAERQIIVQQQAIEQDRFRKEGEMKLSEIIKNGEWDQALGLLSQFGSKVSQGDYFNTIKKEEESDNGNKLDKIHKARSQLSELTLASRFDPMDIKVTSERIFSIAFHPSESKRLILAGDKVGELGLWDVDTNTNGSTNVVKKEGDNDEDEEEEEARILSFKIHTRSISTIVIPIHSSEKTYTSSYDGSIRCLDLNTGTSIESFIYDSDPKHPVGISDCSFPDKNTIYFTTLEGEFGIHDLRQKQRKSTKELLRLHDKKIGGFSYNPQAIHQISTASLDRTLKIWDLRSTTTIPESQGEKTAHNYGQYESRLSISCTDWNSTGQIVVNGYDDTINVFDLSDSSKWSKNYTATDNNFNPSVRIKHNCQTGRWVSILKSKWQARPNDGVPKFVIGNMKRFIDIYSADGQQLAHLGHEAMTAVPAVVQFHPTQNWVVGGSASGKLYLWE